MKKVKNPRSDLSWSEITLVLIKKTIRLVLGSRVAEICSVFEGGLTDVIVVLLLLLSSSPALLPLPASSGIRTTVGGIERQRGRFSRGSVWVCMGGLLGAGLAACPWEGECRWLRAAWKAVSVAFLNVLPNYGSCYAPRSFLLLLYPFRVGFQYGPVMNWCSPKRRG